MDFKTSRRIGAPPTKSVEQRSDVLQKSLLAVIVVIVILLLGRLAAPITVTISYLGADAQHLQRRWYVDLVRDANVSEVDGEGFAPNSKVTDVEHGQVARQGQDNSLFVVATQGRFLAVFVRDADALGGGLGTTANPEFSVW